MYDSDFRTKVIEIVDRLGDVPEVAFKSIRAVVDQYQRESDRRSALRLLEGQKEVVRREWLKETRRAWAASLPSPTDVGLSPLAKCGDYVNKNDRPTHRGGDSYISGCYHKAKYATTSRRYYTGGESPMRVYCGTHLNEIARSVVQFPRGAEGEVIFRERIEGYDALKAAAGL